MGISTSLTPYLPALLPAGAIIAALVAWWVVALPRISLALLSLSLVAGQAIRLPLPGQGGGILLGDVAVVLTLIAACVQALRSSQAKKNKTLAARYLLLVTPFLLWSAFTLLIRIPELGLQPSLIAASYWVRLSAYLLLIPALLTLSHSPKNYIFLKKTFIFTIVTLTLLGLSQITLFPNMSDLSRVAPFLDGAKWDPHQGRLISTWLDPNFFGAFLAVSLPYIVVNALLASHQSKRKPPRKLLVTSYGLLITASAIALALTRSRSAIAALALAVVIFSPIIIIHVMRLKASSQITNYKLQITKRIIVIISCASLLLAFLAVSAFLLQSRLSGFWQYDPTVNLRLASLAANWKILAQGNLLFGVGYNAYQFAAKGAGLINDFTTHSRAGTDNSFLTLLITTGLPGLTLFIAPWIFVAHQFVRRTITYNLSPITSLAGFASLLILFLHAQVVNSFLYSHLLITISIIIALSLSSHKVSFRA